MAQMNGMMGEEYKHAMAQQHHIAMMQQHEWQRAQEDMKLQEWRMQQEFEQISLQKEA
jgi:hypothetical protein